ncbi:germination protein YpeB [Pseudogracilibacillus auburnensis]|uniref:germination protein YpeB n=1 Tax=Pseudogracilibacillus auburnensis TaxID=1494959 RepID=UPI001A96BC5B|nr:germination protein YpeB [Pseudogracilibacillus auburnensis]MBO1003067.1 germination protein YpeB [Pseudogracilibacillus auburnensis]
MIRSILIAVLAVGIAGISYWGYKEHEEKNALLIHAENTYQRSFHELSYHMDLLHDKIGTSLAMNSGERLSPQFVDIWRLTSQALTNVGQLPLTLLPFNKTEEFLSNIGDFTYKTAIRNLDDDPLTDDEIKALESYYKQAANIKDELRQVQYTSLENNLRWMDVELALATQDQADNTIIDGFKTVEKKVGEFAEGDEGSLLMQTSVKDHEFKYLTGERKSEQDIRDFSKKLFSIKDDQNINITKSGEGADVQTFSVSYKDGKSVYMDITQKGSHPISILVDRPINEKKLSLNDGLLAAEKYLKQFDYPNMEVFQTQQFDNEGVFSFTYKQDDVRVYPDSMVVKVALDNGDIIGLNANNYLMNHHERKIPKPKLTIEEAQKFVNGNVHIQEEHLAIIENDLGEEVLTYEFLGVLDDETFRIFINANDGIEEKVEKLTGTETNFEANL